MQHKDKDQTKKQNDNNTSSTIIKTLDTTAANSNSSNIITTTTATTTRHITNDDKNTSNSLFRTKKRIKYDTSRNPSTPVPYNQRDVLGLRKFTEWTWQEEATHLEHNRILQPGFMHRDIKEVLADAKLAGVEWLTDVCCPSLQAALILHIGKEMVVNYKVSEEALDMVTHQIYQAMIANNPTFFLDLEIVISEKIDSLHANDDTSASITREKLADDMLKNNAAINAQSAECKKAAYRLVVDKERKKIIDQEIAKLVREYLEKNEDSFKIEKKTTHAIGKTHDYSFLGAAGSGKSTIAKQHFNESQKTDFVIIATDNYRIFTMPGTKKHEAKTTKNIFTRTQDMAYLIKELIQADLHAKKINRPNIICDCVTLDRGMKALLSQGTVTSAVAAYRGEPGYTGIAERADDRARNEQAAPADKGRFIETTALLKGHADASAQLLFNIPDNAVTTIYHTGGDKNSPPDKIATIDSKKNIIEIVDLRIMSEFLNKRNINTAAINQVDLIYDTNSSLNILSTHVENKAKSIIDLISDATFNPSFQIKLNEGDTCYADIKLINGIATLTIANNEIFNEKATKDSVVGGLLRAITRQIQLGGIKESLNAAFKDGDKQSFEQAYNQLPGLPSKKSSCNLL